MTQSPEQKSKTNGFDHLISEIRENILSGKFYNAYIITLDLFNEDLTPFQKFTLNLIQAKLFLEIRDYDNFKEIISILDDFVGKIKDKKLIAEYKLLKTHQMVLESKLDKALKVSEEGLLLVEDLSDTYGELKNYLRAEFFNIRGLIQTNYGQQDEALRSFETALDISKENNLPLSKARSLFNSSKIHKLQENEQLSISTMQSALNTFEEIKHYSGMKSSCEELITYYKDIDGTEEQFSYEQRIKDIRDKLRLNDYRFQTIKQIKTLEQQNQNLINENQELKQENYSLRFQVNSKETIDNEKQSLTNPENVEMAELKETLDRQNKLLKLKEEEVKSTQRQVKQKDNKIAELENNLSEKDSTINKMAEELSELGKADQLLKEKDAEISKLNKNLDNKDKKLEETNSKINNLKEKIADLKEGNKQLDKKEKQITELELRIESHEDTIQKLRSEKSTLEEKVEQLENKVSDLEQKEEEINLDMYEEQLDSKNKELEVLNEDLQSKDNTIEKLNKEINKVQDKLKQVEQSNIDNMEELKAKLTEKNKEISKLQKQLKEKPQEVPEKYLDKIKSLESEIKKKDNAIENYQEQIAELQGASEEEIREVKPSKVKEKEAKDFSRQKEPDYLKEDIGDILAQSKLAQVIFDRLTVQKKVNARVLAYSLGTNPDTAMEAMEFLEKHNIVTLDRSKEKNPIVKLHEEYHISDK